MSSIAANQFDLSWKIVDISRKHQTVTGYHFMHSNDYPRITWNEKIWSDIRSHCQVISKLPESGSEERIWLDSKPTRAMLLEMVSILDGMERLVSLAEKEILQDNPVLENWLTSIRGLAKRMLRSLERVGVKPVPSLGRAFDANLHEVLEVRNDPNLPPATVVEVLEKPYRWGHRVLRVGKVVVTPKSGKISTSRN